MPNFPTDQDDAIVDTAGDDVIDALAGNDAVTVTNGWDTIAGSGGTDTLIVEYSDYSGAFIMTKSGPLATGYSGSILATSSRRVDFSGFENFDVRVAGSSEAQVETGRGDDNIVTGSGSDFINPGGGSDTIDAGAPGGSGNTIVYPGDEVGSVPVIVNLSSAGHVVAAGHPLAGTVLAPGRAIDDYGFIDTLAGIQNATVGTGLVLGGAGVNDLRGSNATLVGNAGADRFQSNGGTTWVDYSMESGTFAIVVNLGLSGLTVPAGYSNAGNLMPLNSALDSFGDLDSLFVANVRTGNLDDRIYGNGGDNRFEAGGGDDVVFGDSAFPFGSSLAAGNDVIFGGDGNDVLHGEGGNDILLGDAGDDFITAGRQRTGVDEAVGGAGTDLVEVDFAQSTSAYQNGLVIGGDPNGGYIGQIFNSAHDRTVVFYTMERFSIFGTQSFGDLIITAGGDDRANGLGGDDTIYGRGGDDVLDGSVGNDAVHGEDGDDHLLPGTQSTGTDQIFGGAGTDTLEVDFSPFNTPYQDGLVANPDPNGGYSGQFAYNGGSRVVTFSSIERFVITGSRGNDIIRGAAGNDELNGHWGDDVIFGGAGDDRIDGGTGNDRMAGEAGNDVYVVDSSGDTVDEAPDQGMDEIRTALAAYTLPANVENLTGLATTGQRLTGNAANNVVRGNSGDDVLNGAAGIDTTIGGGGNDLHYVDNPGDVAVENANAGIDTVATVGDYTLGANIENLQANDIGGTAPLTLTGNALANNIYGTQGSNVLNGSGGADFMVGYAGNDLYYVDHAGDVAYEEGPGGIDTVATTVSYALGANVENLQANNIGGTDPLSLTGNPLANNIYGTQGNNVLNGGGGADFMVGYGGNDLYYVDHAGDVAYEDPGSGNDIVVTNVSYALGANVENLQANDIGGAAPLTLVGNDLANFVWGTQGANSLYGRGGNDRLYGYGGSDQFVFDSAPGNANFDWLDDFQAGVDKIVLDNAVYSTLANGALPASAFVSGSAAADADDRIVFNPANGGIFYDADGNGAGAALLIAIVPVGQPLTAADFLVI